jgi:hypothetical protein
MKFQTQKNSFRVILNGIQQAFPNMIYGNTAFVLIAIFIYPLITSGFSFINDLFQNFFIFVLLLIIIFCLGALVAFCPTMIGGALLALWLHAGKSLVSTKIGIGKGAFLGAIGMTIMCAMMYQIDRPHGLPDPQFPRHAIISIAIATGAGARTGMQLAKDILTKSQTDKIS